jgi:hypothetical protein
MSPADDRRDLEILGEVPPKYSLSIHNHKMSKPEQLPPTLQGSHSWQISDHVMGTGAFSSCRLAYNIGKETANVIPAVAKTTFLSPLPAARAKQLVCVRREIECLSRLRGNVNM